MLRFPAVIFLASLGWAGSVAADPCMAIPDVGPTPSNLSPGSEFRGVVAYVGDGDSFCVALGPQPDAWVEVRLSDFYAPELTAAGGPEAKAALEDAVLWKRATCTAENRTYDRIAARCTVEGRPVPELLRAAGIKEGGVGRQARPYRPVVALSTVPVSRGSFRNCAAARAAGAAPLYRGQPGYGAHMDGDGDGVACEPFRRR